MATIADAEIVKHTYGEWPDKDYSATPPKPKRQPSISIKLSSRTCAHFWNKIQRRRRDIFWARLMSSRLARQQNKLKQSFGQEPQYFHETSVSSQFFENSSVHHEITASTDTTIVTNFTCAHKCTCIYVHTYHYVPFLPQSLARPRSVSSAPNKTQYLMSRHFWIHQCSCRGVNI